MQPSTLGDALQSNGSGKQSSNTATATAAASSWQTMWNASPSWASNTSELSAQLPCPVDAVKQAHIIVSSPKICCSTAFALILHRFLKHLQSSATPHLPHHACSQCCELADCMFMAGANDKKCRFVQKFVISHRELQSRICKPCSVDSKFMQPQKKCVSCRQQACTVVHITPVLISWCFIGCTQSHSMKVHNVWKVCCS